MPKLKVLPKNLVQIRCVPSNFPEADCRNLSPRSGTSNGYTINRRVDRSMPRSLGRACAVGSHPSNRTVGRLGARMAVGRGRQLLPWILNVCNLCRHSQCCRCDLNGRCRGCVCVRGNRSCTNCFPSRGRCET